MSNLLSWGSACGEEDRPFLSCTAASLATGVRPAFDRFLDEACRTEWEVYAKPPFDSPELVIESSRAAVARSVTLRTRWSSEPPSEQGQPVLELPPPGPPLHRTEEPEPRQGLDLLKRMSALSKPASTSRRWLASASSKSPSWYSRFSCTPAACV